ncbi:unnamed protein product, partial [Candidula unifasciata]
YLVIAHPLSSKTLCTSRNARIALACTWITAILLACPSFVIMGTESNRYYNNSTSVVVVLCADLGIGTQERLSYAIWQLAGLFLVPTSILLYCYVRVICILWLSARQLQTLTSPNRFDASSTESCNHVTHRNGSLHWRARCSPSFRAGEEALQKRKQQTCIYGGWKPMQRVNQLVISCLPYLQSCINPIIYVLMSKNIRTSIRKIACSRCPCKCFAENQWTESISHELIKTNQSQGASSMETYRSFRSNKSTTAHV